LETKEEINPHFKFKITKKSKSRRTILCDFFYALSLKNVDESKWKIHYDIIGGAKDKIFCDGVCNQFTEILQNEGFYFPLDLSNYFWQLWKFITEGIKRNNYTNHGNETVKDAFDELGKWESKWCTHPESATNPKVPEGESWENIWSVGKKERWLKENE